MKIIDNIKMFKPDEVAGIIHYHPRTIRRLIHDKRIAAVDSNTGGKQPVWWVPEKELNRIRKTLSGKKLGRPAKR